MEGTSNTFWHLSDDEVQKLYNKFLADGMDEDTAFSEVLSIDCNLDHEEFEKEFNINDYLEGRK